MIQVEVSALKRLSLLVAILALFGICSAAGGEQPEGDPRLSRVVGHWVLDGRIAGKDTTHDVEAERVLNHLYVRRRVRLTKAPIGAKIGISRPAGKEGRCESHTRWYS